MPGSNVPGGHALNSAPFYIGQSNVFGGRYFDGAIADVAVFNTDLTAAQVQAIYLSRLVPAAGGVTTTPEPGTWALLGAGLITIGGVARRRRPTP